MPELWLPPEDRLALWEPVGDQLRVIGWRPGPAGVSAVELATGLTVVVDHASPTTLAEVAIDLVDGRVPDDHGPVLAALLGDEAVAMLSRLPGSPRAARPVPLRTPLDRVEELDRYGREPRTASSAAATFARLTIAVDLGNDAALPDAARAVAWLEAATDGAELGLTDLVATFTTRSVELFEDAAPAFDVKLASRVASFAGRVEPAVDRFLGARLRRATDRLVQGDQPFLAAAMAAPLAAPIAAPRRVAKRAVGGPAPKDGPDAVPLDVDGDRAAWAGLTAGSHVVVTAGPSAAGTWARVFRRSDRILLGLAPLHASPASGRWEATVVIPRTPAADLVVDVVVDPVAPRRHPTHDAVREAVLAGRAAARLTRRGEDADDAWSATAARWRALGDTQRANLAARHGRRTDRVRRTSTRFTDVPALLADEVERHTR